VLNSGPVLLLAFVFAVMADQVSSAAYAIEATLRARRGDLGLLPPTMGLAVGVIAIVVINYHAVVARYPQCGARRRWRVRVGVCVRSDRRVDRGFRTDRRDQLGGRFPRC
jgi:hypothetical protein